MRAAAVDLGTNSTRRLVADVEEGSVTEVVPRLAVTRLGGGVDVNHEFLPAPIARVHAVLDGYAGEATRLGAERVLALATSALREVSNGRDILGGLVVLREVMARYGLEEIEASERDILHGVALAAVHLDR